MAKQIFLVALLLIFISLFAFAQSRPKYCPLDFNCTVGQYCAPGGNCEDCPVNDLGVSRAECQAGPPAPAPHPSATPTINATPTPTPSITPRATPIPTPTPIITPRPSPTPLPAYKQVETPEQIQLVVPDIFVLNQQTQISVKTINDNIVREAPVTITYPSGKTENLITDSSGVLTFTPSEIGKVTIKVIKWTFSDQKEVQILAKRLLIFNIVPGILAFTVDTQTTTILLVIFAILAAAIGFFESKIAFTGKAKFIFPVLIFIVPLLIMNFAGIELAGGLAIPLSLIILLVFWGIIDIRLKKALD